MSQTKTIYVKFDAKSLPRWAQNDPNVVLGSKYSLSFRSNVFNAKTEQAKKQLKREAERFEETLCANCSGTGEIDGQNCISCQGSGVVMVAG
jgi:RecJ-like exonuclease